VRRVAFRALVTVAAVLAIAVVTLVVLAETETLEGYVIRSSAMEPTLHCGRPRAACAGDEDDRVLVLTRFVSFDRGDIVVFPPPPGAEGKCGVGATYVKRIVALRGDTVETRLLGGASYIYIDGKRLDEPYVEDARRDSEPVERLTVREGHVFVLGDDRAAACDSRIFGTVPEEELIGEVVATWWPLDRLTIR
jgi:signal peptidase I